MRKTVRTLSCLGFLSSSTGEDNTASPSSDSQVGCQSAGCAEARTVPILARSAAQDLRCQTHPTAIVFAIPRTLSLTFTPDPRAGAADLGPHCQPHQLRQAARSALAEAIAQGGRLLQALQRQGVGEVAAMLAAAPAAAPPAKRGRRAAEPPTPQPNCCTRCSSAC